LEELVHIGKVTSVFGVKGWVNVYSYTDPVENILDYDFWLLFSSAPPGKDQNRPDSVSQCKKVRLTDGQRHGNKVIAQLERCSSREGAAVFVQHDIYVPRSAMPLLDDAVYWVDLEGLKVVNLQGQMLGQVARLLATGANDVLVVLPETVASEIATPEIVSKQPDSKVESKKVKTGKATELLIPYVDKHYIVDVDLQAGQITVDWPLDYQHDD
jgi:16S rRNA processing protein RimM